MAHAFAHQLYNWTDTKLWELLKNSHAKESERVRVTLEAEMPQIQALLSQGGTSPTDFTLHDSQHSYRVAERMTELTPEGTLPNLSPYELAMLLLAAYLHDIGMAPPQSLTNQLANFIILGAKSSLTESESAAFRDWTDSLEDDVNELLSRQPLKTPEDLHSANLLIMHYCRHRHVDLSEQWIDANLGKIPLGSYAQWLTDLKLLCRSHNEGYDFLTSKQFDPKPVGTPGHILHLRYLACVLRVADVIEFDPERTPEVIFAHRSIAPGSEIFWFKDHFPTLTMEQGQLTITANPPDAKLHRAIELMCDEIEAELRLVSRLKDEYGFSHSSFQAAPTCHEWTISSNLRRNIFPLNGQYEYIDGAFRPDTKKLLQLLSGKRLYKDEKVALRELLQNAFDAVRERTALERLTKMSPEDDQWNAKLSQIYAVTLDVHSAEGRIWITCTDDGVGMSKTIITHFLLVSGVSQRSDLRHLERRCREKGFRLERTGQFGIGVLSYFMIADFVRFVTRRNSLCPDPENNGWVFETEGIGSFGELRTSTVDHLGTEVSLRLRRDIETSWGANVKSSSVDDSVGGKSPIFSSILHYLLECLCHVPCKVLIKSNGSPVHSIEPGWNVSPLVGRKWDLGSDLWQETKKESEFIPRGQLESLKIANQRARNYRKAFENCLSWEVFEGELPQAKAAYRFCLPVFKLPEGESPAFAVTDFQARSLVLHSTSGFQGSFNFFSYPRGTITFSWKGMSVELDHPPQLLRELHGIAQIDFRQESVGLLSVSRETIQLKEDGSTVLTAVLDEFKKNCMALWDKYKSSRFAPVWQLLASYSVDASLCEGWPYSMSAQSESITWGPFSLPALNMCDLNEFIRGKVRSVMWQGIPVVCLDDIKIQTDVRVGTSVWGLGAMHYSSSWRDTWAIDRVVKVSQIKELLLVPLHTMSNGALRRIGIESCAFPPEWSNLVGMLKGGKPLLNSRCPLVKAESDMSRKWLEERFPMAHRNKLKSFDPRPFKQEISSDPSKAASWLRYLISNMPATLASIGGELQDFWNALTENENDLVVEICSKFANEGDFLFVYETDWLDTSEVLCVGVDGAGSEDAFEQIHQLLPDPKELEWRLSIEFE